MTSWRSALVLLLTAASVPCAAVALFVAWVIGTDCFIECTPGSGNPWGATLLVLLAVGILLAGPVLGRVLLGRRAVPVVLVGMALGAAPVVLLL